MAKWLYNVLWSLDVDIHIYIKHTNVHILTSLYSLHKLNFNACMISNSISTPTSLLSHYSIFGPLSYLHFVCYVAMCPVK